MNRDGTDPLELLTQEEVTRFFHCKKTEMSCMEEPHTFLAQLRDHNLVPELLYQKVIKMKCKNKMQEGVYQILDWLEKERGQYVKLFWTCAFKNHILKKYPVLRLLRDSLLDGSFRFYMELLDSEEPSKNEQDSTQSSKANKKKRKKSFEEREEREEPGPSSFSNPNQKKVCRMPEKKPAKKPTFTTPFKKGETADIWTWDFYKTQLPVICGDKAGTLYRDKLAKRCKSIQSQGRWFTASEFERFAGKGKGSKWKQSICCQNTPLQKLIEEGHLQSRKRRHNQKKQRIQFPVSSFESLSPLSVSSVGTDHEEEWTLEDEDEDEEDADSEGMEMSKLNDYALPVSCGSVSGVLYKSRFAGPRSKSIRTQDRWCTPEEFVMWELTLSERHWKKDILCHGKTLNYLLKKKILTIHSLPCQCPLCCPKNKQEQDNDDVCFVCNSGGDLVCCDECPRAFHHHCHLPVLQERTLGSNWICTFCVLKTILQSRMHMTKEDALNSHIVGNILSCEYLLLCLYKGDTLCVFTKDPTATVPGYTRVITTPMWLDRVKTKLQNKQYQTVKEFVGDIRRIFKNCRTFNEDNEFGKMGAKLSEIFEREFHTSFKIQ